MSTTCSLGPVTVMIILCQHATLWEIKMIKDCSGFIMAENKRANITSSILSYIAVCACEGKQLLIMSADRDRLNNFVKSRATNQVPKFLFTWP